MHRVSLKNPHRLDGSVPERDGGQRRHGSAALLLADENRKPPARLDRGVNQVAGFRTTDVATGGLCGQGPPTVFVEEGRSTVVDRPVPMR
jgi:hypothetical protein